jgi:hypothetical protein
MLTECVPGGSASVIAVEAMNLAPDEALAPMLIDWELPGNGRPST